MLNRLTEVLRHHAFRRQPFRVAARVPWWALHCLLGRPATVRFRQLGFQMVVPPIWRGGGATAAVLFRDDAEPDLLFLKRFLAPGMTVLDGGASTGLYCLTAAASVGPGGRVLAFEPGRRSAEALARSVALNRFSHVQIRREALSDRQGTCVLYYHQGQDNMLGFGASESSGNSEAVATVTVDDVVGELALSDVHLLKLDVEGAQEMALRGSHETLARFRPVVLVEVSPGSCRRLGLDPEGAARLLQEIGYRFYQVTPDGRLVPVSTATGLRNFVAAPAERPLAAAEFS